MDSVYINVVVLWKDLDPKIISSDQKLMSMASAKRFTLMKQNSISSSVGVQYNKVTYSDDWLFGTVNMFSPHSETYYKAVSVQE